MDVFSLRPILWVAGIGIIVIILEKILFKGQNENMSYVINMIAFLTGFGIVLYTLYQLMSNIIATFFYQ